MAVDKPGLFEELKRRHVLRAAIIYVAAVWALSQGISQLSPAFGLSTQVTLWFVIACAIGFPFWLAFAWYFKFTPHGIAREDDIPKDAVATRRLARKLDYWIIGILAVAVVLLLTNQLVLQRDKTLREFAAAGNALPAATAPILAKSVAVLPFANESGKSDEQYFSDGLSDDLITALSQFAGLKVISRNSAFQFRDSKDSSVKIGQLLGVAHLLEGSVQRAGDEVRITATLVNAGDGSIVWSERYDKPYKDLFALQDAITQSVADALKAKLLTMPGAVQQSDRPPGGNLAAWLLYQQGSFYLERGNTAGVRKAIEQFTAATKLDPRYAAAFAALASAWTGLAEQNLSGAAQRQAYTRAREAVRNAMSLNPNLAAAHAARGRLLLTADFDWTGARDEYRRAIRLAPSDGLVLYDLGNLEATLGQVRRAVILTRRALASDPLHSGRYNWLSNYLAGLGRLDEAEQAIRKAIELQPAADSYHESLAMIAIQRGDFQAALTAAHQENPGPWQDVALALARQIGSDRAMADAVLKRLIDKNADQAPYQIAQVYALRQDPDNAFQWLDRAWASRDPGIGYLLYDPFILRYRDDPRFAAYAKKVGLPTTTDAVAMKGGTR
ncbi:MAG: tetratricopeptide repeat protein [Rhodanobacteraceae bacterium]